MYCFRLRYLPRKPLTACVRLLRGLHHIGLPVVFLDRGGRRSEDSKELLLGRQGTPGIVPGWVNDRDLDIEMPHFLAEGVGPGLGRVFRGAVACGKERCGPKGRAGGRTSEV